MATVTRRELTTLNTRRIVVAGVLGAIAIVLGITRLGFITLPNITGAATILHVPVIIGAVLEGPVVGGLVGLLFGIFSLLQDTTGLFTNPVVSVVPRVLVGITSWLAFRSLQAHNVDLAAAVAGWSARSRTPFWWWVRCWCSG